MSLSGRLKDLSIPQVLKLLADGKKSGLLALRVFDDAAMVFHKHYLWMDQGAVVSLSTQIDSRDWLTWLGNQEDLGTIEQRQQLRRLNGKLDGYANLGCYLIEQNYLQPGQIQTLFEQQVVQPIGELFKHNNGFFIFNDRFAVPSTESLGLSVSVRDLNLQGLRQLRNWEIYQAELPESHVALFYCFDSSPTVKDLSQWEQRLIQAADGRRSIAQLAKEWGCELLILQQAAFGLIVSGMVEELSMATAVTTKAGNIAEAQTLARVGLTGGTIAAATLSPTGTVPTGAVPTEASKETVLQAPSNAFLSNLGQFFNRRVATSVKAE